MFNHKSGELKQFNLYLLILYISYEKTEILLMHFLKRICFFNVEKLKNVSDTIRYQLLPNYVASIVLFFKYVLLKK